MLRFKIDTDNLDILTVQALISYHTGNLLPRYQKLQEYYEVKHAIASKTVDDESKPNNKIANDYPGYIVDLITGYFMGKPVAYSSKSSNDTYLQTLQDIFDYNDEADENAELAKTASIQGEAFELLYIDESGNIRFTQIENEQTILVYGVDVSAEPILGVRYYQVPVVGSAENKVINIEAYTKDMIYKYTSMDGKLAPDGGPTPHYFGGVPIIHTMNNKSCMGDFQRIVTLVDAYDLSQSDTQDSQDYFVDAYLKITGATLGEGEEALNTVHQMKQNRVIELPEGGDASFLLKDGNNTAEEAYKTRLNADIHKFAKVPDLSDEQFSGNVSGIAIAFKYNPTESLASLKERKFKKALQRRAELITNILNIKGNNFDYTDIDMTFVRNLPKNISEISDLVSKLKGTISDETLIAQVPFVTDVKSEVDKIKQQEEDNLSDDYADIVPTNNGTNTTNGTN